MESGSTMSRQERVSREGAERVTELTGQSNVLAAQMVDVLVEVIDAEAWGPGGGLRSPAHWLAWRTGYSEARAKRLVKIARRVQDPDGGDSHPVHCEELRHTCRLHRTG